MSLSHPLRSCAASSLAANTALRAGRSVEISDTADPRHRRLCRRRRQRHHRPHLWAKSVGRPRPARDRREQAGRRRHRRDRICRRIRADGYTLLIGASGMAINQPLYAKLPYDSVRDFVAISELASFPLILIVNSSSPIKSVAELVAYAKANPTRRTIRARRLLPARHRTVQAEDRRADAGDSLQERQ